MGRSGGGNPPFPPEQVLKTRFDPIERMAKSDSFFIRAQVTYANDNNYAQAEIDLGSFVNLGVSKSTLLRILRLSPQFFDSEGTFIPRATGASKYANCAWQLTTQSQTAIVEADDKSVISAGGLLSCTDASQIIQEQDATTSPNVEEWTNGFLVGVDTLFLGIDGNSDWVSGFNLNVVLECTLETATQASATALALSQQ